ncbi:MAG: hypothetical protein ACOY90_18900 [Candidatus Zhuqueibacterota bacterium]
MNLKNLTIALIIALVFEVTLKLSHRLAPFIFEIPLLVNITSLLKVLTGVLIILFLFYFLQTEKDGGTVELALKITLGVVILAFLYRLPLPHSVNDFKTFRFIGGILSVAGSALFFLLVLMYRKKIPQSAGPFLQAITLVSVVFAIDILKNLYSLITLVRFIMFGAIVDFPFAIHRAMFVLFIFGHLALIYFLYQFYRFNVSSNRTEQG